MLKRTGLMGTACAAAVALAAPASADTLTGFAGYARAEFQHVTINNNALSSAIDGNNKAQFGIGGALPITGIPNLNVQADASYAHQWTNDYTHFSPNYCTPPATTGTACGASYADSAAIWNFGISPFLAYAGSRWGANLNYETITGLGHLTNGGGFMEWYVDDTITVAAKAGYLHSGGTPQGGHGHYLAADATFYPMPNAAVSVNVDWQNLIVGGSVGSAGPVCGRNCMMGLNGTFYTIQGEWLASEDYGVSIFGAFSYASNTVLKQDGDSTIWRVGLKYYTGMGTLVDRHRNGTLRDFLRRP